MAEGSQEGHMGPTWWSRFFHLTSKAASTNEAVDWAARFKCFFFTSQGLDSKWRHRLSQIFNSWHCRLFIWNGPSDGIYFTVSNNTNIMSNHSFLIYNWIPKYILHLVHSLILPLLARVMMAADHQQIVVRKRMKSFVWVEIIAAMCW